MKKYLILSLLLLLGMPSNAQNSGRRYRILGQEMLKKEQFDLSKSFYDSAYQIYLEDKHFASAALTFLSMKPIFERKTKSDTAHHYMRIVYDSAQNYKKYNKNTFVLRLKLELANYYFHKEKYDSSRAILSKAMGSTQLYGQEEIFSLLKMKTVCLKSG